MSMRIREVNLRDLVLLEGKSTFPLGNLNNPTYVIKKTIEENDELIGSFFVKLTSETSLVFNGVSPLKKARALKMIFEFLSQEIVSLGLNDNHVFLKDLSSFESILKKHFGFEDIIGTPLVLRGKE